MRSTDIPGTIDLYGALPSLRESPRLLSNVSEQHAEEISRTAASGLNLLDLSVMADPYVRPMLAYYGCEHLMGALSRAFFSWRGDRRSHGLSCDYRGTVEETEVIIEDRGFFQRVANALAIIGAGYTGGGYNLFSARDAADLPITNAKGDGPPINNLVPRSAPVPTGPIPIPRRVRFDALASRRPMKIAGGSIEPLGDPRFDTYGHVVLVDILMVFVAGSVCRYKPRLWRGVLDGVRTSIRVEVDAAIERVSTHLADGVTQAMLEARGLTTSLGNPYSALTEGLR